MPAIPYIQPIPKWIEEELESRANNQARMIRTTPFVTLISPAIVTKTKHTNRDIVDEKFTANYKGCVLSNTTDVSKLYQTGNSIIGYDLDGKAIEVEGEANRKISVPLIIDLQIEDGGANAALKTAKLNIKVFSLKQLEMFEMFFLRPGMQLLLEYGNNSDLTTNNTNIQTKLFPKTNWETFVKEFVDVYSPNDKKWADNKDKYIQKLKDTKGNYDVWTGKVQGYSFSVDTDGTYNVSLEISAGNELASQLLTQAAKPEGKKSAKIVKGNYQSYVAKLAEDIDPELLNIFKAKDVDKWKKEFFNWGVESKKAEDNTISKTPYISVRLALKIINSLNYSSDIIFGKAGDVDVIPVTSTKYMMSSDERIIFPGTLPNIITDEKTGKIQVQFKEIDDPKDPLKKKKTFEVVPGKESKINGYSFNLNESGINVTNFKLPTDKTEITLPKYVGNLLNIFISYDTFVGFKSNSIKNSDLLFKMLELIQMSMYGYCYLELATCDSSQGPNTGLTIIDRKLERKVDSQKKPYRFKIGPTNSLIHTFSFDFQMDDLMAGQTLYSSQLTITEAKEEFANKQADNQRYPETLATSANMEYFKNADGLYSINPIEVKVQKQIVDKKIKDEEAAKKDAKPIDPKTKDKQEKEEKDLITKKVTEAKESIKKLYVRFRLNDGDKDTHNLIYQDVGLLKHYLVKEPEPDTVLVSGVDVTIAIDGMSGFATGDYFHIDGVPEVYNQNGYFQIESIQQGINNDGWLTTIIAGWMRKAI
jgi:hypothetical protein